MKKILYSLLFLTLTCVMFGQKIDESSFRAKGEVYFRFALPEKSTVNALSRVISIDNVKDGYVYAYANLNEFTKFLNFKLDYTALPHPGDVADVKMAASVEDVNAWDAYPTYDAYVTMMTQFQTTYPNLCKIIEIGTTVQGRKLLMAKISNNVNGTDPKPNFMFTSSIHGDETTGYVLMLRLIDYLLSHASDAQVANILSNLNVWINPLANPDGTYKSGNSSVSGAVRYNGNSVDVNRNFPDLLGGQHPDGNAWQPEALAMMSLGAKYRFVISANFHGGVEVLNYPYDCQQKLHPDDAWFQKICRAYADTVHKYAASGYLTYLNNGITNGWDWYEVYGGRQDYFTIFLHGREVTMEISNTKLLPASQLPAHWEYHWRSFLQYMENVVFSLRGTVTSATTGQPLKATITIQNHDFDGSEVMTDSSSGTYVRMIVPGTYTMVVSADGYVSKTISNVQVVDRQATIQNIQLQPVSSQPVITWQNTLTVKDNSTDNKLLTFGTSPTATNGIDSAFGEISLPPAPPAGVLDARFELPVTPAEFSSKDFRRDTASAISWIVRFQPGPGGYPMTLTWNSAALPAGTFALKDLVTGTVVNVDMKAQSSVAVSNTGITALKVEYSKQACSNLSLNSGWNIVSIPLAASSMSAATLFPQATSAVFGFTNGYVQAATLSNGAGYWVRYPQSASVQVCGGAVSATTIPLVSGWNLIGGYMNNVAVSGLTTTPANIINSVFYEFNNSYVQATTLQSGKGYWVRATQAGTLNLAATEKAAVVMPRIEKNDKKIMITDAAGQAGILYAGDMANSDLPPVPPAGIFDVRFASQRSAEDINGKTQVIQITGASYPVTVKTSGVAVKIQDVASSGRKMTATISNGGQFVIADPAVTAIQVSSIESPATFALGQNYPNPFNPSTVINYQVATNGLTTMKLYDVLGCEVMSLVNEVKPAGSYSVTLNAAGLKSGVYFYTLRSGNYSATKKLVVVK